MDMDLESILVRLRGEYAELDRAIRSLERVAGIETPSTPSPFAVKRRGRPPGSKTRHRKTDPQPPPPPSEA